MVFSRHRQKHDFNRQLGSEIKWLQNFLCPVGVVTLTYTPRVPGLVPNLLKQQWRRNLW